MVGWDYCLQVRLNAIKDTLKGVLNGRYSMLTKALPFDEDPEVAIEVGHTTLGPSSLLTRLLRRNGSKRDSRKNSILGRCLI